MASWRRVRKWHGTFRRMTWVSAYNFYADNPLSPMMIWKKNSLFYSLLTNVILERPPNWTKSACFADKWVQYIYSAKRWRRIRYARCIDWDRDIRYALTSLSLFFFLSPLLTYMYKSLIKRIYYFQLYICERIFIIAFLIRAQSQFRFDNECYLNLPDNHKRVSEQDLSTSMVDQSMQIVSILILFFC